MLLAAILLFVLTSVRADLSDSIESFSLQKQEPKLGDPVTLYCNTSANIILDWTRDGVSISQSALFSFTGNSLHVRSFSSIYDGFYRCVVKNETGEVVQVQTSPPILLSSYESRIFTRHPENHTARLGGTQSSNYRYEPIVFICELVKTYDGAKPIITWQVMESSGTVKNLTDFNQPDGEEVIIQYDHTGYYQRHRPTMDDDGLMARCIATSSENPKEFVYSDWATAFITTEVTTPDPNSPFTSKPPKQYYIEPGQNIVRLPCTRRDGEQGKTFTFFWYLDTTILFYEENVLNQENGVSLFGRTNLQIDLSQFSSPNRQFVCRSRIIVNGAQIDKSADSTLSQSAPAIPAPDIEIEKMMQMAMVGKNKVIPASYTSSELVLMITWWRNGQVLNNPTKYVMDLSGQVAYLTIQETSVEDAGVYQSEIITGSKFDYSVEIFTFELRVHLSVKVNAVSGIIKMIAPNATSPYTCTPAIPRGELLSSGKLVINSGVETVADSEHRCISGKLDFTLIIDFITPAYITDSSGDIVADVGSQVVLKCDAEGDPNIISFQWTRNNKTLPGVIGGSYTISSMSLDDIGEYECIPMNSEGTLNTSIIQVDIRYPGIKISKFMDTNVTVAIEAPSGYTCMPPIPQGELTSSGDLVVSSGLDESASREYVCISEDIDGDIYINLDVVVPAFVVSSTEDTIADIGSNITLQCVASGIPSAIDYTWHKDGNPISGATSDILLLPNIKLEMIGKYECIPRNAEGTYNTSKIQLDIRIPRLVNALEDFSAPTLLPTSSSYNCTPQIPNGEVTDAGSLEIASGLDSSVNGQYRCKSRDITGSFIIDLTVVVPAYITESSGNLIANTRSNATLQCSAAGIPSTITFEWKKNGRTIPGETATSYTIREISVQDVGNYECIPRNSEGTHNTSVIQLDVRVAVEVNSLQKTAMMNTAPETINGYTCTPSLPSEVMLSSRGGLVAYPGLRENSSGEYACISNDINGTIVIDLMVVAPAYVVSYTSGSVADVGSNITLTCLADGIPNSIDFVWRKNGEMLTGANTNSLSITKVLFADIGEYECIPRNPVGTHNTSKTQINVRIANYEVNALANRTHNMFVPTAPNGYTCTPPLPRAEISPLGTLSITAGLKAEDSGDYSCTSEDINGSIVINFKVYAQAYITCPSEDMEVNAGSRVQIRCTATGIPDTITFTWKKNGRIINETTGTYVISLVSVSDTGTYECIPNNIYGHHNSSTVQLKVIVTEIFDWFASYTMLDKFPPTQTKYSCLPVLPPRLMITSEGHVRTDGLKLQDQGKYKCTSEELNGIFTFHVCVQGYAPDSPVLNSPFFNSDHSEVHMNWTANATRLKPIDRYMLVWRREDDRERHTETSIITENNSYVLTNFSRDNVYIFWVIAQNEAGSSNPSNEREFNVDPQISTITRRGDFEIWIIVIIVICCLVLCCICCILCCIFFLWCGTSRSKVYYAEDREKKYSEEMERYRKKGEDDSDSSESDEESKKGSITGDKDCATAKSVSTTFVVLDVQ